MTSNPITGVLPVLQLPFAEDESVDFATLQREIAWVLELGAQGVVMAMVTETLRLSDSERMQTAECICDAAAGRAPVIISVGAESTKVAERFAQHAQQAGAAAVMAIPPTSVRCLPQECDAYFRRIARAVDIPLIVQDASGYVGSAIDTRRLVALLDEFGPEKVWFKPEAAPLGPSLSALRDQSRRRAVVYEGSGGIALLDNFRRGIAGTMPGTDLIVGVLALWRALEDGRYDDAYQVSLPLSAIVALQTGLDGFLAVEKHLLVRQEVFTNARVRGPVGFILDGETRSEVDRLFDRLLEAVQNISPAATLQ